MKYSIFGLYLLLVGFGSGAFAQSNSSSLAAESISFSIPKTIFFGGERIWVDLAVESEATASRSQIAYVELLNRYNESVAIAKIPLNDGKALNFLRLPNSLPSDHYLLRVFTRVSAYLDMSSGLKQQFITVFNPEAPPRVEASRDTFNVGKESSLIVLSSPSGKAGEMFSLQVNEGTDELLEVKVAAINPFLPKQEQLASTELYQPLEERTLVPELFGHIVEGFVDVAELDTTQLYYLSIHGEKSALFTDRPDSKGTLYFDTGGIRNWRFMIAQALGNQSLVNLTIVSPAPQTNFLPGFSFPELIITPQDEGLLRSLLLGGQIEGYFSQEYRSESFPVVTGFVQDQTYILDDYTRFDKVETVIKEYVPEVSVKTIERKKEFRVIDLVRGTIFDSNPLMIVDAMPIFDSDLLAKHNPEGFQKLEILSRSFFLNEEEFPGVLSFSSYNNDFGGFPIPSNGVYLDYQGLQFDVTGTENLFSYLEEDRLKDWRTILHWSSSQQGKPNTTLELELPELTLTYQVEVRLRSASGEIRTERKTFQVMK